MTRLAPALAALGLAAQLATPASADTAEVLAQIQADFIAQRQVFDDHRREFGLVRQRASEVKVDLRIARDPKLELERAPSAFGPLDTDDMLAYLPEGLLKDLERRLAIEYMRGGDEWLSGYWPPIDYQAHSHQTIRWTQSIFGEWNRNTSTFGLPYSLSRLHVRPAGSGGAAGDFDRLADQLPALRRAAENALSAVEDFEPDVEWGWTWYPPFRREKLKNKDEWEPLQRQASIATNNYRNALVRMRESADAHVRQKVEEAVDYEGGNRPSLGFLDFFTNVGTPSRRYGRRTAGGGVYADLWNYWFDEQVLRALPASYLASIQDRLIQAYFLGARDAKHDQRNRPSTGGSYGTGDGYGWGDDTRYRASGSRRTGYWDTGTGNGSTGGSGTGTGGGTGGTGGNDHGPWIPSPGTGDGGMYGIPGTGGSSGGSTGGSTGGGTGGGTGSGAGTGSGTGSGSSGTGSG